ncbi:MAG: transposase [Clostridiaceae bacterium]
MPSDYEIKSATISQAASGKYYISVLVEFDTDTQPVLPCADNVIGLDYSSKALYIDNLGIPADYPKYYRKMEVKLKREQRKLSKRMKGGKNRDKQREKVAKLHEKVANQRKDYLHKQSRQIANAYDAVVVEDLNMRGMAQGLKLAKSTNDNGFGMLRTFLEYKLREQGKQLIVIDKWYPSSKTCHVCGEINNELTLADRAWTCICGTMHDRDINAAINIRKEGCRMLGIA